MNPTEVDPHGTLTRAELAQLARETPTEPAQHAQAHYWKLRALSAEAQMRAMWEALQQAIAEWRPLT